MIILDYRERKIIPIALEIDDVKIYNLQIGDILIPIDDQAIIIERKNSVDFIESIKNSRLWDQLARLQSTETILDYKIKRRILLIHEQMLSAVLSARMSWASIFGALQEIVFVYNIQVFHTETNHALSEFIRILIQREKEKKNDGVPNVKWERKINYSMDDQSWKIYILSSIPYVGEKTAKLLLEKFGSIENISNAKIYELKKIKGIGDEKAKLIYKLLH
ncbi:MAG: ERCC4 domain-containing protein [Thermoplasmata archaeon]|nr:helix-hairpin-helix domain-containing protein [Thermoplasmata archaeon]